MPTIVAEGLRALRGPSRTGDRQRLRKVAILWCGAGALVVLLVSFFYQLRLGPSRPPGLTAVLAPVNLFTGVFGCGVICLLNPWVDRRLPRQFRLPAVLRLLNVLAAAAFLTVGVRGYWEYAGWTALGILLGTIFVGLGLAQAVRNWLELPAIQEG
jgi:hypothetical protein